MNTEIKNNSTDNNLLRCLFSLEGRTFYNLMNRDNNVKTGKVLRLSVDKMCRNLAAVGNATTEHERPRESTKARGREETPEMGAVPQHSSVVILSKNLKSSLNRFSDNIYCFIVHFNSLNVIHQLMH